MQKLSEQPHHSSVLTVNPDTVNRGEPVLISFTWYTQDGEAINIEDSENHIKMIGFYDQLSDKYYRFTGGKGNVYTLTTSFISIGQHKLQAFFNHVDKDDKKLLDIYANIRVRLQRSASNPGMSLRPGANGGVKYDSAERAIKIETTDGSNFLYYPSDCANRVDYQAENAEKSELLNIIKEAGISYNPNLLNNVATAIKLLIHDNSYAPEKIFACNMHSHNICDPNFDVVLIEKTDDGCRLAKTPLKDLLQASDDLFNLSSSYTPALLKILNNDDINKMDIVFQDYVNADGKPENQLKTMSFKDFKDKYLFDISKPFKEAIRPKQDEDKNAQILMVKTDPDSKESQIIQTPITDLLPDVGFDPTQVFKKPIAETQNPTYTAVNVQNLNQPPDSENENYALKPGKDEYQLFESPIGIDPSIPLKSDIPTIDTPTDTALTVEHDKDTNKFKLVKAPIKSGGSGTLPFTYIGAAGFPVEPTPDFKNSWGHTWFKSKGEDLSKIMPTYVEAQKLMIENQPINFAPYIQNKDSPLEGVLIKKDIIPRELEGGYFLIEVDCWVSFKDINAWVQWGVVLTYDYDKDYKGEILTLAANPISVHTVIFNGVIWQQSMRASIVCNLTDLTKSFRLYIVPFNEVRSNGVLMPINLTGQILLGNPVMMSKDGPSPTPPILEPKLEPIDNPLTGLKYKYFPHNNYNLYIRQI